MASGTEGPGGPEGQRGWGPGVRGASVHPYFALIGEIFFIYVFMNVQYLDYGGFYIRVRKGPFILTLFKGG